jgi:hypothetical protein
MSKHSKSIDRILKRKFFLKYSSDEFMHNFLCEVFQRTKYQKHWNVYWKKINTNRYTRIDYYLPSMYVFNCEYTALLRLLVVEDFKKYMDSK